MRCRAVARELALTISHRDQYTDTHRDQRREGEDYTYSFPAGQHGTGNSVPSPFVAAVIARIENARKGTETCHN